MVSSKRVKSPPTRDVSDQLERYRALCRARSVPCTRQRIAILQAVLSSIGHPTADEVHAMVKRQLRDVSRTTVYRVLEELAEMGLIGKACHPGKAVRYDRRTDLHHHLVCLRCNSITDISDPQLDAVRVPDTGKYGFKVSDFRVQVRGLCKQCRKREERK